MTAEKKDFFLKEKPFLRVTRVVAQTHFFRKKCVFDVTVDVTAKKKNSSVT